MAVNLRPYKKCFQMGLAVPKVSPVWTQDRTSLWSEVKWLLPLPSPFLENPEVTEEVAWAEEKIVVPLAYCPGQVPLRLCPSYALLNRPHDRFYCLEPMLVLWKTLMLSLIIIGTRTERGCLLQTGTTKWLLQRLKKIISCFMCEQRDPWKPLI